MALMQQYRGKEEDFDPAKMKPGQFAVSLDKKYIRMCFDPGLVERIALYDAFEEDMLQIQQILATCEDIQTAVKEFEHLAEQHATQAETYSSQSKSWAVGGTGTRQGEDTDNSKYYAQKAKEAADKAESVTDIGVATAQKAGIVKPDNKTIRADSTGTLSMLNWSTRTISKDLDKWCKIASVTLLTTRFEDFTAVILAQELEMMYGSVLIHWNCNSESGGTGVDKMKTPCRMTALCGNGRTMSEFFEKCFFTECVQTDETHVTYNLWYEPKLAYLRYAFSLLGVNTNYDKDYEIFTNPEFVTTPLTGRIVYPEKNTWPFLTANLLATVPGTALDATMGKLLNDKIPVVEDITVTPALPGTYICKKYGNMIILQVKINSAAATHGGNICTIPAMYAPSTELCICPVITGSAKLVTGFFIPGLSINETGIVRVAGFTGTVNILGEFIWVK